MARGPSFLKDKAVEHFSNIEIYNLLAGNWLMHVFLVKV